MEKRAGHAATSLPARALTSLRAQKSTPREIETIDKPLTGTL